MFGDCKLMIRFRTRLFNKSDCHSIYWALEQVKKMERQLGVSMAYRHITREANVIPDNMARLAILYKGTVMNYDALLLDEAPENQLQAIYK